MRLAETPFWLLSVSLEDEQETVEELAEEKTGEDNREVDLRGLAQMLRKPKDRVGCEVGWLPGLDPDIARSIAEDTVAASRLPRGASRQLPPEHEEWWKHAARSPLALANLRLACLERGYERAVNVSNILTSIAIAWSRVDPVAVAQQINRHRAKAGIRAKATDEMVGQAIEARRVWMQGAVKRKLDSMPTEEMVETVRLMSDQATKSGTCRAPEAVRDWLRMYERGCAKYFTAQLDAVKQIIRQAEVSARRKDLDRTLSLIQRIQQALTSWDKVAQPIQLLHQGEGSVDPVTDEMFRTTREFSIRLNNEFGMGRFALMMVKTQRKVFHEAERLAQQAGTDEEVLMSIVGR